MKPRRVKEGGEKDFGKMVTILARKQGISIQAAVLQINVDHQQRRQKKTRSL